MSKTKTFVLFDSLGNIQSTNSVPDSWDVPEGGLEVEAGEMLDADYYVDVASRELVAKADLVFSKTVNGLALTLEGLPPNTELVIDGQYFLSDSEPTEILFDTPGKYEIGINPPPQYKYETLEVTVG